MGAACDADLGPAFTLSLNCVPLLDSGKGGCPPPFGYIPPVSFFQVQQIVTPAIYLLLTLSGTPYSLHLLHELHHTEQIIHLLTPDAGGIPATFHQHSQA